MNQIQYLANGYRLIEYDEIGSTNAAALEYSQRFDTGKLWITAKKQLLGKGSRGRSWVSEPGNLYTSLLLLIDAAPEKLATLSFVTSIALFETLANFVPKDKLALKWPNDILLNEKKVSGILLENHVSKPPYSAVIIGIGVNCQSNPADTRYAATHLAAFGQSVDPAQIFDILAVEMDQWLNLWDDGNNFSLIRRHWLDRAAGIGEKIIVKMPQRHIEGIFEDIDLGGRLILKTAGGLHHTISVADIFFPITAKKVHKNL